jgi:hypothetical protein
MLGTETKNLPFTCTLAEVVEKSAEKGCGIWAKAGMLRNATIHTANAARSLRFTMVFSLKAVIDG